MSLRHLIEQFDVWRGASRELVLATVVNTVGSTYTKPGAHMVITADNQHCGLLSGGCLEGDLMLRAQHCFEHRRAVQVNYDMRDRTEDEMWGLGLGCEGSIDIVLQPLLPAHDWQPFAAIASAARSGKAAALAMVVDDGGAKEQTASGDEPSQGMLGATVVLTAEESEPCTTSHHWHEHSEAHASCLGVLQAKGRSTIASGAREQLTLDGPDGPLHVLIAPIIAPLRLLLLGAGPDTVPVMRMARELGWYLTQADHRPANLTAAAAQAPVDASHEIRPGQLAAH
ncbi:MAG: XdhC family protein, partial [Pseudomonadota bacterium]